MREETEEQFNNRLMATIAAYWRENGRTVPRMDITAHSFHEAYKDSIRYRKSKGIISNMKNGLPEGKKDL